MNTPTPEKRFFSLMVKVASKLYFSSEAVHTDADILSVVDSICKLRLMLRDVTPLVHLLPLEYQQLAQKLAQLADVVEQEIRDKHGATFILCIPN